MSGETSPSAVDEDDEFVLDLFFLVPLLLKWICFG